MGVSRALLGTILLYTAIAMSIIYTVTSPTPDTALATAVQSVGLFFQGAVGTLELFAVSTTVPPFLFEVAYVIVGLLTMGATGVLVMVQVGGWITDPAADEMSDSVEGLVFLALLTVGVIGVIARYFGAGAQFLVLGVILLVAEVATILIS